MPPTEEPGHSDHMGTEPWRIETVTRLEHDYEGCDQHGRIN